MKLDTPLGPVTVHPESQGTATSPHTGRELRVVTGTARVNAAHDHERLLPLLKSGGPFTDLNDGSSWKARLLSHSITDGKKFRYQLELEESEVVSASTVVLDGRIELSPSRYAEEVSLGQTLLIELRAEVEPDTAEAVHSLREEKRPISVLREGVSEIPREMRFGRCRYSVHDDGTVKYQIVLVEPTEEDSRSWGDWVADGQARSLALKANLFLDELWSILDKADIVSSDERAAAMKRVEERFNRAAQEHFERVDDVDELEFRRGR